MTHAAAEGASAAPATRARTTQSRSEVGTGIQVQTIGSHPEQGRFPGAVFADCRPLQAPRRRLRVRATAGLNDPLLETFANRSACAYAAGTARQYAWALRDVIKLAAETRGRPTSLLELFLDRDLLGSILTSTRRAGGGPEVAGWTVPARRTAVYAAASQLAPELRKLGIPDPRQFVNAALRLHAERIGNTYRLPKPVARNYGRGKPPTAKTIGALLQAAGSEPGWMGERDRAFFEVLIYTGARVNAVRCADGATIRREPDGSARMLIHAKHPNDSGEFTIPAGVVRRIDVYAREFNRWARARCSPERIGIGVRGPLWRSERGTPLAYAVLLRRLTAACVLACVPRITPHAFRHAFATLATEDTSRFTVAAAGGWAGPRLMDDHYIGRDRESVAAKLAAAAGSGHSPRMGVDHATVHVPVGAR